MISTSFFSWATGYWGGGGRGGKQHCAKDRVKIINGKEFLTNAKANFHDFEEFILYNFQPCFKLLPLQFLSALEKLQNVCYVWPLCWHLRPHSFQPKERILTKSSYNIFK
jgi:hypothetical protein